MSFFNKPRCLIMIASLIVTALGIIAKFYSGWGSQWVNNNLAGIWYEMFWCLFGFLFFFSHRAIIAIPIWVFLITCLLEFLQLWHPPILELIRSHLLGRFLIGTTFSWWDFPYYVVGCFLGWWVLRQIWQYSSRQSKSVAGQRY